MQRGSVGHQNTLASPVSLSGIGLHTGVPVALRLCPAPANTGIVFRRTDLEGFEIEALARNVARVSYATSLMKKGVLISTTEHLLSALAASWVDNVYVEIDNLEVPIMDGSALPFFRLIQQAGLRGQRAWRTYAKVVEPVEVINGAKGVAVYPSDRLSVTYQIGFPHPLIGEQSFTYNPGKYDPGEYNTGGNGARNVKVRATSYETEIAPARTFGFIQEVEKLRRSGLVRGGSLENAVVLAEDGVMNPEGLRFPDEFCRHKILDLIGDLVMLGHPLIGRIVAERAGHAMHAALVQELLRQKSAWTLVTTRGIQPRLPAAAQPAPLEAARLS